MDKVGVHMHFDKQILADYNKGCVIELITKKGPINRAEIARQLGLSIPTIMKITDSFMENGIIRITGKGESTGGKRPELYEIMKEAYYFVGVDIGRSKIHIIIINLIGEIVEKMSIVVKHLNAPSEFIKEVMKGIEEVLESSNIPRKKILGIGIGTPGILETEKGIILYSPDFGWENVDVVTPIRERFDVSVIVENSNRTMALGEQWIGGGQNASNIFCVNVGHGIGAAILKDDEVYKGSSGTSGEFGHMVLKKDGPLCECGNVGCLESLSSGNAIAKRMGMSEAKEVFDLMREGNQEATEIINEAIEYLGIGIANAINILDPDMVILEGGIMKSYELFWEFLLQVIKEHQMKFAGRKVKIRKGMLGTDATAVGAASLLIRKFKKNGGKIN